MGRGLRSMLIATALTGFWAFSMFGPVATLNVLALIAVMLPLWFIHDLGVSGLGSPNNGFFVPTSTGFLVGGIIIWFLLFVLLLLTLPRAKTEST